MSSNTSDPKEPKEPAERLSATFLTSAPDLARCPVPDQPEVAFAGRSNAGKSSVLNRLTGNRNTAKVSKTPGRTQLINLFDVTGGGRIADLPGYGYAKASKTSQAAWQAAVNDYLNLRECLVGVVLVMDIRHPLQDFDTELIDWAAESELPLHILLNKADKLGRGAQQQEALRIRKILEPFTMVSVQTFSASQGLGTPELLELLQSWLQDDVESIAE